MKQSQFARFLTVAAAAGGLALAGCGGSDENTAASDATPVASTPSTPDTGGTFKVGESTEISFTDEAGGVSSPDPITVETEVTKIAKGKPTDLAKTDGSSADGTPYYVSLSFRNTSGVAFEPTAMTDAFGTTLSSGGPAERITVSGAFPPCEQERPTEFEAGDTIEVCTIFMAPKGDTLDEVWRRDRFGDTWTWKAS